MSPHGLHGHLVDALGRSLTSGEHPAGTVLRLDELTGRYRVSRTVAREAVRVLEALRMVRSRPKVGTIVLPATEWNLFDPLLIRWRLAGADRTTQLRQLAQLRMAVEPAAAGLAALHAGSGQRERLLRLAQKMSRTAGATGTDAEAIEAYVAADITFHRLLLAASGNEMFAHLGEVSAEVLQGRLTHRLLPTGPDPAGTSRHLKAAEAINRGDAEAAERELRSIVTATAEEVDELLD
ncbi:FadR/GntR family transcriptional regulator [Amycolatopsis nigrescens]|uniref:FadR/GntR family transcriptional regulator n=1 Tax=Amycolatopsis nigrescens TaxID=381445 RepID=UPI00058E42EF|nr:FCD domain-containing protein [Amycolatopsis nigrescens]